MASGLCFAQTAGPRCFSALPALFGALSLAFFVDSFRLGYTVAHSLWHVTSATAAILMVA